MWKERLKAPLGKCNEWLLTWNISSNYHSTCRCLTCFMSSATSFDFRLPVILGFNFAQIEINLNIFKYYDRLICTDHTLIKSINTLKVQHCFIAAPEVRLVWSKMWTLSLCIKLYVINQRLTPQKLWGIIGTSSYFSDLMRQKCPMHPVMYSCYKCNGASC